ncbi:lysophospholipase [Oceanisphaera arctica]|uniref:Lysophospholipase n=2 Tax=Oceanisphaera arctica TaxID=641510 RepID=A0A2P5TIT4_9GAMM|nr:alpha/beta fold hydrolase [Oceanisphaera arctica]PPL14735.1 lysophospholipase [Oceanisphaera arctica]GHA13754.1 lysophospholipase L2 [Oceanisphaera arctica]
MLARLFLIGIFLLMNTAIAAPRLITEAELSDLGQSGLNAFWQRQAEQGHFVGTDGLELPYASLSRPEHQKAIVLVNGRTESYLKYQELAFDLFNNGYNVYLYDHRGQGLAPRLLQDPLMGYVADFDDYVQDLEQFMQQVVLLEPVDSLYLLSHSMGGTISALWLSETQVRLQAAALSSPMMGIYLGPMPRWLVDGLLGALDTGCHWLGHEACYAPGQGGGYVEVPFKDNDLTHSEARYKLFRDLYRQRPELQLGGASLHWLQQSLQAGDSAIAKAGRITTPLLVLQAGNDVVVDNRAQNRFCQALAHCHGGAPQVIKKASHELFIERDRQRQQALEAALSFFEQYP